MTNQIIHGDCLEVMRTLPASSIDLTVTSPPYDNLRDYNKSLNWNFQDTAALLYLLTKPGGVVVWIVNDQVKNGSESGSSFEQALFFKSIGFNIHDTMVWQKMSPYTEKSRYIQSFEYMFIFSKGKPKTVNLIRDRKNKYAGDKTHGTERKKDGTLVPRTQKEIPEFGARTNIWDNPPDRHNKTGHPAVFPIGLVEDHILTWSNPGDVVLDPFLGSGTTALAAIETGRQYIGIEKDKEYFEIARRRINDCK